MNDQSIKQIADSLNINKLKVYRYIKNNNIEATSMRGSTQLYSEEICNNIIEYFKNNGCKEEKILKRFDTLHDSSEKHEETKGETFHEIINETVLKRFDMLNETLMKQLDTLSEQLKSKDEQLAEKDKQIAALYEQNKALTDALVVAQTLHAATIQTTSLVDKSIEPELKWWQKILKKKE